MPRIVIVPGLEFDARRRYKYGLHAAFAFILVLISFVMIELRNCNWAPGVDLDRLQALHVSMFVFAFVLYLLSLFGIADFIFQYKFFFFFGAIIVWGVAGLMVWMTYQAAISPCVQTFNTVPIDLSLYNNDVFSRGDPIGIIVLLLDIVATLLMISAAINFYKRY